MTRKRLKLAASEKGHNPRWRFDCNNCKFNWCCGPTCACVLSSMSDPPSARQREVDAALIKHGYHPEFRQRALDRLRDSVEP